MSSRVISLLLPNITTLKEYLDKFQFNNETTDLQELVETTLIALEKPSNESPSQLEHSCRMTQV